MQKKSFVLAAVAVLCLTAPAFSAGSCQDWKGVWSFTYSDNMTVDICFDNTTLTGDNFTICDNDSAPNCQCLDNITSAEICLDNETFQQCQDNESGCVCVPNPFYVEPSVDNGQYEIIIDEVEENVSSGVTLNCRATGVRTSDNQPMLIVQPTPATFNLPLYRPFNFDNGTWLIYESAFTPDVATKPFTQIMSDNFTGDAFVADEFFNTLGIVSGTRTGDLCQLRIIPSTVRQLVRIFNPVYPFVMIADRENEFEMTRPVELDWGTDSIRTIFKLAVTKKVLIGFALARPFQLETDTLAVTVTNSTGDSCFGVVDIQAMGE